MKTYKLENGKVLYDVNGKLLVLSPFEIKVDAYRKEDFSRCGGWILKKTQKGRDLIELLPGDSFIASIYSDGGDRSWGGWNHYVKELDYLPNDIKDKIFAFACSNSAGGGMWLEVNIFPVELQIKPPYHHATRESLTEAFIDAL